MRIGRIIAMTAGAALAAFGVMRLARSRSSEADLGDGLGSPDLDLTSPAPSSNADESRLTTASR
jgi:hypothetical protein